MHNEREHSRADNGIGGSDRLLDRSCAQLQLSLIHICSLKFNKENIDARNLLGLCYYETGEAVSALCEWVISKNLKGEDNIADSYINELQSNKNRLDTINQTIRKYNQSVLYCREDNEDMAIIQLKKVISQNSKFVKAYQLLALLYMKRQEYERARKLRCV